MDAAVRDAAVVDSDDSIVVLRGFALDTRYIYMYMCVEYM